MRRCRSLTITSTCSSAAISSSSRASDWRLRVRLAVTLPRFSALPVRSRHAGSRLSQPFGRRKRRSSERPLTLRSSQTPGEAGDDALGAGESGHGSDGGRHARLLTSRGGGREAFAGGEAARPLLHHRQTLKQSRSLHYDTSDLTNDNLTAADCRSLICVVFRAAERHSRATLRDGRCRLATGRRRC